MCFPTKTTPLLAFLSSYDSMLNRKMRKTEEKISIYKDKLKAAEEAHMRIAQAEYVCVLCLTECPT